jgi:hypothetical protein
VLMNILLVLVPLDVRELSIKLHECEVDNASNPRE